MEYDVNSFPVGLVRCNDIGQITFVNDVILDWVEVPSANQLIGKPFYSLLAPAGRIYFETHLRPMLLVEGRFEEISLELLSKSKIKRPVYLTAHASKNTKGQIEALHIVCFKGQERHKYEQELVAQKRKAETYEALVKASPDAIINIDSEFKIRSWNRAATGLFGYNAHEAIGKSTQILLADQHQIAEETKLFATICEDSSVTLETVRLNKKGDPIDIELSASAIKNELGEFTGAVWILRDISERIKAETKIKTLNREVVHRTKNLLSIVQGIASMTARHSAPDEFLPNFQDRIKSLGKNLSLLVNRDWTGVEIKALIEQQLSHLSDDVIPRISLQGPVIKLPAEKAEALSMAIFELSTNAVKYGALSTPDGKIEITWQFVEMQEFPLKIEWRESGASNITEPTSKGFGSLLTGQFLEYSIGGVVTKEFEPQGLQWTYSFKA